MVWRLSLVAVVGVVVIACGGSDEPVDDPADGGGGAAATEAPDPCLLAGDAVLEAYFGEAFPGEPGEAGPIATCRWRDANANSLLIQTATDFPLTKPDPCDGCITLPYADDGYASESPLQSSATFVVGSGWYSVTTTGFGDNAASIASLGETVLENANA